MTNENKAARVNFCSLCNYCKFNGDISYGAPCRECSLDYIKINCDDYQRDVSKDINSYWGYKYRKTYNAIVFLKNSFGFVLCLWLLLICCTACLGLTDIAAIFLLLLIFFIIVLAFFCIMMLIYLAYKDVASIKL